jgi:hypothetical protein
MTDNTRFTLAKTSVVIAGVAGALTLTACSGGATVSGRLDDTRYVPGRSAVYTTATRTVPTYTRRCTTKTRTKTTGSGKFRKTSTESYRDCQNVRTGSRTESYRKTIEPAKSAIYCVELDDVNGDKDRDDRWYEVDGSTYYRWAGKDEGALVNKMPYRQSRLSCH